MTSTTLSEKKLFAYLIVDDIELEEEEFKKLQGGNSLSQSKVGDIYYNQKGYTKAIEWYRLSAVENNDHAQYYLGDIYYNGRGVSKDFKLAMEWFLKAHENGDTRATCMIGIMYSNGRHVEQDYKMALEYFHDAVDGGYKFALVHIGSAYENGRGVKADIQFALEWYEQCAELGYQQAKDNISRLNKLGHYYDEKLKRYRQIINELDEQKSKVEALEDQLKVSEQKRLESDNEIKLLKKQFKEFKMALNPDAKDKVNMKQEDEQSDTDSNKTSDWVKTENTNDEEAS